MEQELIDALQKLRDDYITATPRQRLSVVRQRMDNPYAYPNLLVTRVSGVEALARSLVMNMKARTKDELRQVYSRYKSREAHTLVEEYLKIKGKEKPSIVFGDANWKLFKVAVNYRNLLAHECTYLENYKFEPLEDACLQVLKKLASIAKLKLRTQ